MFIPLWVLTMIGGFILGVAFTLWIGYLGNVRERKMVEKNREAISKLAKELSLDDIPGTGQ